MNKKGFSLAEIIVSTIVMTMLMVSVIAYIQYGGEIWQDGHSKISNANYLRMATEVIRTDLIRATEISDPPALPGGNATPSNIIEYRIAGYNDDVAIGISNGCLIRKSNAATMSMRIARNLASFTVTRLSTWTLQVHIELQNDEPEEDGTYSIIASETLSFMAPGAG